MNCKSYIPEYYTMRGLNKDTENSWPIYYDNKLLNGHLHNGCMFNSLNGYSEYDREMLKRTMLEHEATFRKQVYELHRLYRIQKELMEEFQRSGLYRFSTWTINSKNSLSLSEAQSQVTGRMWEMYHQPSLSSSHSKETTTATNTNVSPISTLPSSFGTQENGAPGRDGELNASFRASTKKILDLQVPADVYIDAEVTERSDKEEMTGLSSVTVTPYSENEVKLTLANVSSVHKYDSHRKSSLFHCLADLNEPIKDTSLMETSCSIPSQHYGLDTQLDLNHRPNGSLRSTNFWLPISTNKNQDCDVSGYLPEVKKELSQVCSQFLGEAGKSKIDLSLDSCEDKCSMPSEPLQMSSIKASDILLKVPNKAETLFVQKKDHSLEVPRKSSNSACLASVPPAWLESSGGEKQSSAPLQTISTFEKSTAMKNFQTLNVTTNNSSGCCDRLQFCSDLSHGCHLKNGKFSLQNGLNHGFHQDCYSLSQPDVSYRNINLNSRESCSFDVRDLAPKNEVMNETDGNCEDLLPVLPLLESNSNCNESLIINRLPSRLDLCFNTSGIRNEGEVEIKTPIPSCNVEDFPSNLHCGEGKKTSMNVVPDFSSREKIIGFPIFDKIQPNVNFLNERHEQVDVMEHVSLFRDINSPITEKELSAETRRSFRNHIDLNCEVTSIDEPNLSKMTAKSPVRVPSETPDASSSSKAFPLIYMDAPSFLMSLEETNTPEIVYAPCSTKNDLKQNGFSHDVLIREAADNMVMLSTDKFKHLNGNQSCLDAEPPCNNLHWFAEMVLLNTHMKDSDAEMDLFELMTLQLDEMKPEEAWCSSQETENAKENEKGRALLLFKKPRRGQARKRRQRRDFQKDTLPGLATLSRKEMVEDLRLIGGLLKASGCHWEVNTGRRNSVQNGSPAKAKRRQLPRKTTIADTKEHRRPQQKLFLFSQNDNNSEFEVERPGMVGWGRTTRRCQRSRCHPPQRVTAALT